MGTAEMILTGAALSADAFAASVCRAASGRQKNTTACVICGSGAVENVMAVLNAMGGLNIHSAV